MFGFQAKVDLIVDKAEAPADPVDNDLDSVPVADTVLSVGPKKQLADRNKVAWAEFDVAIHSALLGALENAVSAPFDVISIISFALSYLHSLWKWIHVMAFHSQHCHLQYRDRFPLPILRNHVPSSSKCL